MFKFAFAIPISTMIISMRAMFLAVTLEPLLPEQWAAFSLWVLVMIGIAIISIVVFKSVWLKDGFSGINKILEDHEALKFLAAVMSFIFIEIFVGLIATDFSGRYPHEVYIYSLVFAGCVGTGGYAIADKVMRVFGKKKSVAIEGIINSSDVTD